MDNSQPAGWFETEAEEQERREREEWERTEDGGVLVVGHNRPGLIARPYDWPT